MKKVFAAAAALMIAVSASADEGMWLLPLLQKMNSGLLEKAGCKLTPEQIYSVNNSSLKDAIVQFGGGCTGEIISAEGLIVTNHHCGYSSIQGLSTPEHNYLMDGYWAFSRDKEIPVPGLSVTFLRSMTDVTAAIASGKENADSLARRAERANPNCSAVGTSFYNGNVSYLIVYRTYRDVRFVGAPPASIGKFGGETDNWMWPRHTGDFSMFRVYSDKDGNPAAYSPDNVPYKAPGHLKISLDGVKEGDYAMIMGYPGRTQRFQTAAQLQQMIRLNRVRIDARTVRQDLMWDAMCKDPDVQLKYANKYASSANGWKKWQGEELAFSKLDIIGREKAKEEAFSKWVSKKKKRTAAYGSALSTIEQRVSASEDAAMARTLLTEAPARIELVSLVSLYRRGGLDATKSYYRDYEEVLDRKEAVALLDFYRRRANGANYLDSLGGGFDSFASMDIEKYVDYLFSNSVFTSEAKLEEAVAQKADLKSDPAWVLGDAVWSAYFKLGSLGDKELDSASKAFAAGLLEWEKGKPSYPDANFTMRLTYGHVLPYSPKDAVLFRHFTTLKGVMEKEDASNPEFIVPAKLKKLYESGDYGRWADDDGTLHTCFLTNNDITGGNSGSPVLDANGRLIGLAFDGNWESMSSDVMFEPDLQRCICVDIRYVLFLVEKFGGAENIIKELEF